MDLNRAPESRSKELSGKRWHSDVAVTSSLPPALDGPVHAYLRCEISQVILLSRHSAPNSISVVVQWWGEVGDGTAFKPQLRVIGQPFQARKGCKTVAVYPIRCSLERFAAYLRDMRVLTLQVLDARTSSVIGQVHVADFQALVDRTHQRGSYPLLAHKASRKVGQVHIHMSVKAHQPDAVLNPLVERSAASEESNASPRELQTGQVLESGAAAVDTTTQTEPDTDDMDIFHTTSNRRTADAQVQSTNELFEVTVAGGSQTAQSLPFGDTERCLDLVIGAHASQEMLAKRSGNHLQKLSDALLSADGDVSISVLNDTASVASYDTASLYSQQCQHADLPYESDPEGDALLDEQLIADLFFDQTKVCEAELSCSSSDDDNARCAANYNFHSDDLLASETGDSDSDTEEDRLERQLLQASNKRPMRDGDKDQPVGSASIRLEGDALQREAALYNNYPSQSDQGVDGSMHPSTAPGGHVTYDMPLPLQQQHQRPGKGSLLAPDSDPDGDSASDTCSDVSVSLEDSLGVGQVARLGRVRAARVAIDHLQFTDSAQRLLHLPTGISSSRIPRSRRMMQATKAQENSEDLVETVFAEYLFPVVANSRDGAAVDAMETVRAAAKPSHNGVHFFHRSVFPVHFTESTLRRWWRISLLVKVFCRRLAHKPELIGVCSLPLRSVLCGSGLSVEHSLPLLAVSPDHILSHTGNGSSNAMMDDTNNPNFLGTLKVKMELSRDGESWPSPHVKSLPQSSLNAPELARALHNLSSRGCQHISTSTKAQSDLSLSSSSASGMHDSTAHGPGLPPTVLHLLLLIPSAHIARLHSNPSPSGEVGPQFPNTYLVCRSTFNSQPITSDIRWGTLQPVFNFRLLMPVLADEGSLKNVCDSLLVVEVWNRRTQASKDELLGLVKFPLHQFYFSFRDSRLASALDRMAFPVVSVNGERPILPLASSQPWGSLRVLLAMGSVKQISAIEKKYENLADSASLQADDAPLGTSRSETVGDRKQSASSQPAGPDVLGSHEVEHVFTVEVVGIHQLTLPSQQSLWGESDCYVQYRFPASSHKAGASDSGSSTVEMEVCRTSTTLCTPEPRYQSASSRHTIRLPVGKPVQTSLIKSFSMPTSATHHASAVAFDLWQRFYSPNVRDKIMAKAVLPIAKACALVTMHSNEVPTSRQVFHLPLTPLTASHSAAGVSCGKLEVALSYQRFVTKSTDSGSPAADVDPSAAGSSTHVCIGVDVRRVTGLQPAVKSLSVEQPSLHFAATAGANVYARVKFLDKASRSTPMLARVFCAEFAHHTEYACPVVAADGDSSTGDGGIQSSSLADRLQHGQLTVQVYHKVHNSDPVHLPAAKDMPFATGVVDTSPKSAAVDSILLGEVVLPLEDLLSHSSGIHGWFALANESITTSTTSTALAAPLTNHLGAVELAVEFQNPADRTRVIEKSRRAGWLGVLPQYFLPRLAADGGDEHVAGAASPASTFQVEFVFTQVWLPRVLLPFTLRRQVSKGVRPQVYVRYRFFNQDAVISQAVAVQQCKEGSEESAAVTDDMLSIVSAGLHHHRIITVESSDALNWYLLEEQLEVQVWCTDASGNVADRQTLPGTPQHDFTHHHVATAYVHLAPLSDQRAQYQLSGLYPLVRATAASLLGACLRCHVALTPATHPTTNAEHTTQPVVPRPAPLDTPDGLPLLEPRQHIPGTHYKIVRPLDPGSEAAGSDVSESEMGDDQSNCTDAGVDDADSSDTVQISVLLEEALHLPQVYSSAGRMAMPNVFVSFCHGRQDNETCQTAILAGSHAPKWNELFHVSVNHLLLEGHSSREEQQQDRPALPLVLRVFHQPLPEPAEDGGTRVPIAGSTGSPSPLPAPFLIGQAAVDLTALSCGLPQLSGWYNILDTQKHACAQIKVTVTPSERVAPKRPVCLGSVSHAMDWRQTQGYAATCPTADLGDGSGRSADSRTGPTEHQLSTHRASLSTDSRSLPSSSVSSLPTSRHSDRAHPTHCQTSADSLPDGVSHAGFADEDMSTEQIRGKVMSDLCTLHEQLKKRLVDLDTLAGTCDLPATEDRAHEMQASVASQQLPSTTGARQQAGAASAHVAGLSSYSTQPLPGIAQKSTSTSISDEFDEDEDVEQLLSAASSSQFGGGSPVESDAEFSVVSIRSLNESPHCSDIDMPAAISLSQQRFSPTLQAASPSASISLSGSSSPSCSSLCDMSEGILDSEDDMPAKQSTSVDGCDARCYTPRVSEVAAPQAINLPCQHSGDEASSAARPHTPEPDPGLYPSNHGEQQSIPYSLVTGTNVSEAEPACHHPSDGPSRPVQSSAVPLKARSLSPISHVTNPLPSQAGRSMASSSDQGKSQLPPSSPSASSCTVQAPRLIPTSHLLFSSSSHHLADSTARSASDPPKHVPNFFLPTESLVSRMQAFRTSARQLPADLSDVSSDSVNHRQAAQHHPEPSPSQPNNLLQFLKMSNEEAARVARIFQSRSK